jgi:hypothetical protein
LVIAVILIAAPAAGAAIVRAFPGIGASGADELRRLAGDAVVAQVEGILFKVQDTTASLEYRLGLMKVSSPWQAAPEGAQVTAPQQVVPNSALVSSRQQATPVMPPPGASSAPSQPVPTRPPSEIASNPSAPVQPGPALAWTLPPVAPLGSLPGEGVWSPYLVNPSGQLTAQRTFLQPDPQRPYALLAVVAFNLQRTRLHFVVGTTEPYAQSNPPVRASGAIPPPDLAPGVLIAAFNGGFKYAQGHFGAMAGGLVSAPPQDGLATAAIDANGQVQIGAWGQDISPTGSYQAYRQNGPLAIRRGQISPQVADPRYWGYTIRGTTATWRSGLGISQDGNTLYYFAGPYLTINTLTRAMAQVGAWNAMQLDINDYWVHFDSFRTLSSRLTPEPLLPAQATASDNRFLKPYSRDFFYVTNR